MIMIDGVDLTTLGVIDSDIPEARDGSERDFPMGHVPGHGPVHLSRSGELRVRRITVVGWVTTGDHATVLARLDALKHRIEGREVEIILADQLTRRIRGVPEAIRFPTVRPYQTQRFVQVRWTFLCADPFFYETAPQAVNFTSGATQTPLGSARSRPVITVIGPAAAGDSIIYRNSAGAERGRFTLAKPIGDGAELRIEHGLITLDGENAAEILSETSDFITLDPLDGVFGGAQPTLEHDSATIASAVAQYARAW